MITTKHVTPKSFKEIFTDPEGVRLNLALLKAVWGPPFFPKRYYDSQ